MNTQQLNVGVSGCNDLVNDRCALAMTGEQKPVSYSPFSTKFPKYPTHNSCDKRAILIVEDDVTLSEFMCEFIDELKVYEVCVANTCDQARELFIPGKFFVIILDLEMDGDVNNGIDLAVEFRHSDDNVFIAVLTGHYPIFDSRLIETIDELLGKPIEIDILQSKLFMWSIKYIRRKALKCYFDERMVGYTVELAKIRGMELAIRDKMIKLASSLGVLFEGDDPNDSATG